MKKIDHTPKFFKFDENKNSESKNSIEKLYEENNSNEEIQKQNSPKQFRITKKEIKK